MGDMIKGGLGDGASLSRSRSRLRVGWVFAVVSAGFACASPPPADAPSSAPEDTPPPPPPSVEQSLPDDTAPIEVDAPAAQTKPDVDPGPENAKRICHATCDKMKSACSERAADFCRSSCGDYVNAAERCPVEVEAALGCQHDAEDFLLCSNIAAPSCAPLYLELKECREGGAAPKSREGGLTVGEKSDLEGFSHFRFQRFGFSQLLPNSAKVDEGAPLWIAEATGEGGLKYTIAKLPAVPKLNASSVLRAATAYVGRPCEAKLRLTGQFETGDVTHVRFSSVCSDGMQYQGMFHFWPSMTVAVRVEGQGAIDSALSESTLDAYLFGFEKKGE